MKKNKKTGWMLVGAGALALALSLTLLFLTDSVFSTLFFYLSFILNIIGAYILLWGKNGGEKNGEK